MELEEAIKILKEDLEHTKRANECGLATKGEFNKEIEAIEVILNHLKQKDHELNYQKNYCTMVTESKDDIIKSMAERMSKQEKMIELMAYEIDRLDDGSVTYSGHENFIENIKQYFEKKAEESE